MRAITSGMGGLGESISTKCAIINGMVADFADASGSIDLTRLGDRLGVGRYAPTVRNRGALITRS